jgi:Flp pilus assembly protein TadD
VIAHDASHHRALANLSMIAEDEGHHEVAVELLRRALRVAPETAEYHLNLGASYGKLRHDAEAVAAFESATRLRPEWAQAQFNLGQALANLGADARALAALKRAAELKPDNASIQRGLAGALARSGDLPQALDHWERAVALAPTSENQIERGTVLRRMGLFVEAIEVLNLALTANRENPVAHAELAAALLEVDRLDEAESALVSALELDPACLPALRSWSES